MATGINLLPQDTKPKVSIIKLSNKLKRLLTGGFIIFIFLSTTVIGIIFILSRNLKASLSRQEDIKNRIQSLEGTEQKLVLIRDRIGKVKEVQGFPSAKEELATLDETLNYIHAQEGSGFSGAELTTKHATISINTDNSNTLSKLLYTIYQNKDYKQIDLISLKYIVNEGYTANLSINK